MSCILMQPSRADNYCSAAVKCETYNHDYVGIGTTITEINAEGRLLLTLTATSCTHIDEVQFTGPPKRRPTHQLSSVMELKGEQ